MKFSSTTAQRVGIAGIASLITVVLLSLVIQSRLSGLYEYATQSLDTIERDFIALALLNDRTEPTEKSRLTVRDCDQRTEFDSLLSKLSTLTKLERARLGYLFGDCADYFYRVKQDSTRDLAELANAYELHLTHLSYIYAEDTERTRRLNLMKQIVREEDKRAEAMYEQLALQRDVIAGLDDGTIDDATIERRAREITVALTAADQASDTAREELSR